MLSLNSIFSTAASIVFFMSAAAFGDQSFDSECNARAAIQMVDELNLRLVQEGQGRIASAKQSAEEQLQLMEQGFDFLMADASLGQRLAERVGPATFNDQVRNAL